MAEEVYVSVDVETDGPIPGPHSMLSLGAAAFNAEGAMTDTFTINLETLPGGTGDERTMAWWRSQPKAWKACRADLVEPAEAMERFVEWLDGLGGRPVFVAYPAGFDFTFVYWYLIRFVGRSPFSHSALDIKTMAMVLLQCDYRDATKRNMPRRWFGKGRHTHVALDDAIEQGQLFCRMLAETRERFRED